MEQWAPHFASRLACLEPRLAAIAASSEEKARPMIEAAARDAAEAYGNLPGVKLDPPPVRMLPKH
jgi:hypothetical protein